MTRKIVAIVGLLMVVVSYFQPPSIIMGKFLSLLMLFSVIIPIIKSFKTSDYQILVLFAFVSSYVIIPFNYFWFGKHIVSYNPCERLSTVYTVLQIMGIFHFCLLYFLKFSKQTIDKTTTILAESNATIFLVLVVLSLLFTTFGSSGQNIFQSGSYGEALDTRNASSLFGYSLIPLSLCFIYADTPRRRKICYICIAYFCLKDVLFGGRVDTLQLLLILFFIRFQYQWSKKKIVVLGAIGALFMVLWGAFRSDVNMNMMDLYLKVASSYFSSDSSIDFQAGNSAEVYYASVRIIYLIEEGLLDMGLRLQALFYFFLSAVVPYSFLPDVANLSSYLQKDYWSGGGGLGPVFFYAFAGLIGVFAFTWFISHSLNQFHKRDLSKFARYYLILFLATTPRWYAYYPIQLIKFCVVGTLFWIVLEKCFKKKKTINKEFV